MFIEKQKKKKEKKGREMKHNSTYFYHTVHNNIYLINVDARERN